MTDNTQPEALRDARWYVVDKDGMATLCTDREDAEQEAKDANMAWPHTAPHRAVQLVEVGTSAAELHPSPPEGMVGGWKDIATAPKDGSEVLASTAGLGRIVVYWDDDESQWGTGLGYLHLDAPTHWMPLPPQPTTSAGSEKGE